MPISSDLSDSVFGTPTVELDGTRLEVRVPVLADEFTPGKYTASIKVRGGGVVATAQGVSFQRRQGPWWPTAIAILCAIVGLLVAVVAANLGAGDGKRIKFPRIVVAVIPVLVAVFAVWKGSYYDAEIWEGDPLSYGVLIVAALPAALGAAGTALIGEGAKTDR